MRLTFAKNASAQYDCTNVTTPQTCSKPTPGSISSGPAEVYYTAYSIWSLTQYINTWYTVLTSKAAIPAITADLQDSTKDIFSAATLMSDLLHQYANDTNLSSALADAVIATDALDVFNEGAPISSDAQELLGELLSDTLDRVTDDFISGNFLLLGNNGMLLNKTADTVENLVSALMKSQ